MSTFQDLLNSSTPAIGTLLSLPSPELAEIAAQSGADWLFLDLEHGAISVERAQAMLQAAGPNTPALIRTADSSETSIKKALDIGPSGVIVPQVRTVEQAQRLVDFSKYPPLGQRSIGIARAQGYGQNFANELEQANQTRSLVIQIEHIDAVNQIDSILAVDGVDAVFIGPYDLSASMGKLGKLSDAEVSKAIDTVLRACQAKRKPCGIFAGQPEPVAEYLRNGFSFVALGIDAMLYGQALSKALIQARNENG